MEPRDFRTAIDAAEQAAAAADFATAERLLRQAARLQEEELGPLHPDLANTLNNLGIVCENTGQPDAAEAFYRRASEIAAATLPADHPFVATSRRNLEDFARTRTSPATSASAAEIEQAFDLGIEAFPDASSVTPPPPPAPGLAMSLPDAPAVAPTAPVVQPGRPAPAPKPPGADKPGRATARSTPAPSKPTPPTPPKARIPAPTPPRAATPRWMIPAGLAVGAILAVLLITRPWAGAESPAEPPNPTASEPQPARVEPSTPVPAAEDSAPGAATPAPAAKREVETARPPEAPVPPAASSGRSTTATLAVAEVCHSFSTGSGAWRCDPVENEVSPGRLAFYTRVRSPRATTIVHRWYQDDRLRQTVTLSVAANSTAGYRTYSRQTVNNAGSTWRVEARTADGAVLHEERFVVK